MLNLKRVIMNRFVWVFILLGYKFSAQNMQYKTLSLSECIDFALLHNENIRTGKLEIDYQKQFKKAATEIPKTNVLFAQGQFNSRYKYDNSVTVMQQIPFPAVFT